MTKIAYLDCPTGIAGDMCLGALVDAGVPLDYLIAMLGRLGIDREYRLWAEKVLRNGQQATKVHVDLLLDAVAPVLYEHGNAEDENAANESIAHPTAQRPIHSATERSSVTETSAADAQLNRHSHTHSHTHSDSHGHTHSHAHSQSQHSHSHTVKARSPEPRSPQARSPEARSPDSDEPHGLVRHLPEVERLIVAANLPARAEAWSLAVFRKLAEAEGAIHGVPPEHVHFHEVGATDAIVDIVGTCLGLDWLGIDRLYCSPLPTGGGTIRAAHGRLPVPAPAVLKLFELRQVPIYSNGIERELVTPTGAAIATTLATQFGSPPTMTLHRIGLGAGSISLSLPNILRLWLGEMGNKGQGERREQGRAKHYPTPDTSLLAPHSSLLTPHSSLPQPIALLETQIDDLNPQAIGYLYDVLFEAGALDVFTQAIGMKKARPGVLLTVVCLPDDVPACETVIFRETTTLGIRRSLQQRSILERELQAVQTEYGTVAVKVAWRDRADPQPTNVQPEYEDCARIARQQKLPWRAVHHLALQTWHQQHNSQ